MSHHDEVGSTTNNSEQSNTGEHAEISVEPAPAPVSVAQIKAEEEARQAIEAKPRSKPRRRRKAAEPQPAESSSDMAQMMGTLTQAMQAMQSMASSMAAMEKRLAVVESAKPVANQQQVTQATAPAFTPVISADERWFVRIKPYNKRIGHVRLNQHFHELGKTLHGGTGKFGSIPDWTEVSYGQAIALVKYRQRDGDPNSPQVLDVVTEAERAAIDQAETSQRMASIGAAGMPPAQVLAQAQTQAAARVHNVSGQSIAPGIEREMPSVLAGAEQFHARVAMPAVAQAAVAAPSIPPTRSGRAVALQGIEVLPATAPVQQPAPAEDRGRAGVDEDITAAAVDADMSKEIAAAKAMHASGGITSSVHSKHAAV